MRASIISLSLIASLLLSCPVGADNKSTYSHNGINFNMTQKDVEEKGFVCSHPEEQDPNIKAECKHMDLTGVAFGYPTKDYRLIIGSAGKVDMIDAKFSGNISMDDYMKLHKEIQFFFPNKNEKSSFHSQGTASRDEWRDKNNTSAVLLLIDAIPPIRKTSLSITFWSPSYIEISDKEIKPEKNTLNEGGDKKEMPVTKKSISVENNEMIESDNASATNLTDILSEDTSKGCSPPVDDKPMNGVVKKRSYLDDEITLSSVVVEEVDGQRNAVNIDYEYLQSLGRWSGAEISQVLTLNRKVSIKFVACGNGPVIFAKEVKAY